jgi:hypothetical protein
MTMWGISALPRRETKEHARFIAQRIGTEKPYLAKPGSYIRVRDEKGEIFEAPITERPSGSLRRPYFKRATCLVFIDN